MTFLIHRYPVHLIDVVRVADGSRIEHIDDIIADLDQALAAASMPMAKAA